jgi:acetoacetate decarboxylase
MEAIVAKKGLLQFGQFGESMPVTDPYIPVPPVYPRQVEQFVINFEADYDSVAHKIPEPLEFDGDVPTGAIVCNKIGFVTDATAFLEAQLAFNVTYNGKPFFYVANLFVSSAEALVAGREVYGYAKKLAHCDYYTDLDQYVMTVDRPRGIRIFSASVRIHKPATPPGQADYKDTLCLKLIPSPVEGAGPQVCQLVAVPIKGDIVKGPDGLTEFWECSGSISWGSTSQEDPWHDTKITSITGASFSHCNSILQHGYIVHDYLGPSKSSGLIKS